MENNLRILSNIQDITGSTATPYNSKLDAKDFALICVLVLAAVGFGAAICMIGQETVIYKVHVPVRNS